VVRHLILYLCKTQKLFKHEEGSFICFT
jgi:hypothetical protein